MLRFDFHLPTRVLFGPGRLKEIERTPYLPAGSRTLIVVAANGAMMHHGLLPRVQGLLSARGVATMVYECPGPPLESAQIDAAAARVCDTGADFVVGLGDEGAIDLAKGAAFLAGAGGRCWDHAAGDSDAAVSAPTPLPMVAIPVTAGAGSAVNGRCLVVRTDGPAMADWQHPSLFPRLAVVDPELTEAVTDRAMAAAGLNAFCQAADILLAPSVQPAGDMLALEAVQILNRYLPRAMADGGDAEARTLITWAATAAGISAAQTADRPLSLLAHALEGGATGVPPGLALAVLAGTYFEWIGRRRPERMALLADAMGAAEESADGPTRFAGALTALTKALDLLPKGPLPWCPDRKRRGDWTRAALAALGDQGWVTAPMMTVADIEALLGKALCRESLRPPGQ